MKGISVIICCYNSAARIPETIRYLSEQKIEGVVPWEIILVDNNCTDGTNIIAAKEFEKYDFPATSIVFEQTPGLAFARKRGIEMSKYEFIIFCDDDNWLAPDYLSRVFSIMTLDAKIGALGGAIEAVCESMPPDWLEMHKSMFAVGKQSDISSGDISRRKYLWGAGMVLRKSLLLNIHQKGFENLLIDRKGGSLSSGGDSELSACIILSGYKLWYDEKITLKHFIPSSRLTDEYLLKLNEGIFRSLEILNIYFSFVDLHCKYVTLPVHDITRAFLKILLRRKLTIYQKILLIFYFNINSEIDPTLESVYKNYLKLKS